MSKEISDLMGRLNGDMIALQGMEAAISPPPPAPPPTVEQAMAGPPPIHKAKKEDYEHVKKLVEEIKGLCNDLQAVIDKETKVPPGPEDSASSQSGSGGKEKSK